MLPSLIPDLPTGGDFKCTVKPQYPLFNVNLVVPPECPTCQTPHAVNAARVVFRSPECVMPEAKGQTSIIPRLSAHSAVAGFCLVVSLYAEDTIY
jgi:hypothetical protein